MEFEHNGSTIYASTASMGFRGGIMQCRDLIRFVASTQSRAGVICWRLRSLVNTLCERWIVACELAPPSTPAVSTHSIYFLRYERRKNGETPGNTRMFWWNFWNELYSPERFTEKDAMYVENRNDSEKRCKIETILEKIEKLSTHMFDCMRQSQL